MQVREYDRESAIAYAHRWALSRNPEYYDFHRIGGDCTNFVSQCVFAGSHVMNQTPIYGWYYRTANNRTASWTGVQYFYNFMVGNHGEGPFAEEVNIEGVYPGDVIQLSFDGSTYHHTLFVVAKWEPVRPQTILVATHSLDSDNRPLAEYQYWNARYIHFLGVRQ